MTANSACVKFDFVNANGTFLELGVQECMTFGRARFASPFRPFTWDRFGESSPESRYAVIEIVHTKPSIAANSQHGVTGADALIVG